MVEERAALTVEQYAKAEARIDVHHPVITTMDRHLPMIAQLEQGYSVITSNDERFEFIAKNYGFLADALVDAGPYTLEPEDLIAIWSRAREIFPQSRYQRYRLAGMVSSAYAVQGLENPEWKKLPRHYLETSSLPEEVITDKVGLLHVQGRLNEVSDSLSELNLYVFGTKESGMTIVFNLAKRLRDDDPEASKDLDAIRALEKTRQTPLLEDIHENFGNGFACLYFPIDDALELAK